MARPVEIEIPTQASETAKGRIPEAHINRVANALRAREGGPSNLPDEEYIVDRILNFIKETVIRAETRAQRQAVRQDIEQEFTWASGFEPEEEDPEPESEPEPEPNPEQ